MKYSLYNNYVAYGDGVIAFNALSMNFMYIYPELMDLINNCPPQRLKDIHPDFYSALKGNGFICDDKVNEYMDAIKLMRDINRDSKSYRLIINPTTNCNFCCWYCYESHTKTNKMEISTVNSICLFIEKVMANPELKHFQLSFFGGEPLLHYSDIILPIAKFVKKCAQEKEKDYAMDITSNAYLFNIEKFKLLKELGLQSCQITIDGSKEQHNKTRFPRKGIGSYSVIVRNIHIAVEENINIVLRINYTQENLEDIHSILKDFEDLSMEKRKFITLSMNKVWQEKNENLENNVKSFVNSAKKFGFTIPDAFEADHVRNSCYADKDNEAVINYDGKIYKCNARDFTDERHEGILDENGNIVWNELHSKRIKVRNTNKQCGKCSIFPICGGGCSQVALENAEKNYCIGKVGIEETIKQMFLSKYCIKRDTL